MSEYEIITVHEVDEIFLRGHVGADAMEYVSKGYDVDLAPAYRESYHRKVPNGDGGWWWVESNRGRGAMKTTAYIERRIWSRWVRLDRNYCSSLSHGWTVLVAQ